MMKNTMNQTMRKTSVRAPATIEDVAVRFEQCATTLSRLPGGVQAGHASYWPEVVHTPRERARQPKGTNRLSATPADITAMEQSLTWFDGLNLVQRELVWARAYRTPWRQIARQSGLPRTSAQRYWNQALLLVLEALTSQAA